MQQTELISLIDGYLDETLSAEQAEQLFELLNNRHDAKMEFFKRLDLHAAMISDPATVEVGQLHDLSMPRSIRKTNPYRRIMKLSVGMILCVAFLACAIIGGSWTYKTYLAPQATYVESTRDVQFSRKTKSELIRAGIKRGEWIDLKTGFVELRFRSGAELTLQGPARLQVVHAERGFLEYGKLTAFIPEEAQGFVIQTDSMELVDWGTEFLVESIPEKESTAIVRTGRCGGRPVINGRPEGEYQEITAGNALTFPFSRIAYKGGKPPRDWIPASRAEAFSDFDKALFGVESTGGSLECLFALPGNGDPLKMPPSQSMYLLKEGNPVRMSESITFVSSEGYLHLSPGTLVQSYLIQLADVAVFEKRSYSGEVTFSGPILGVIYDRENLVLSDPYFCEPPYLYSEAISRGLDEIGREALLIDDSRQTLMLQLPRLDGWFDHIRVLVEVSED